MPATAMAVVPVFMLIALGWAARQTKIMPDEAWAGVNRLAFYVLSPFFMLDIITNAELSGAGAWPFIAALLTGEALLAAAALCALPFLRANKPAYASVFQTTVRWNAIVLLAAAPALFGSQGLALVALAVAPMTLACNFLAVAGLSIWGANGKFSAKSVSQGILGNPLILGSFGAALLLALDFRFPEPFASVIHQCGTAGIPLVLLCVGAGLDFKAIGKAPSYLATGVALRLVAGPLMMALAAHVWGLTGVTRAVVIACGSTPTAAAGYVLARQMGGDAKLMAGLVTATTLLSAVSIPLALALFAQ